MTAPLKVLISGSGIAGPCFAYWLSKTRLNVSIKIVERSPVPRVSGQAVDLRGSAIDIVKKMNLLDKVKEYHTTEEGTVFVDSKGEPYATFGTGDGRTPTAEFEILRADLGKIFMKAVEDNECVNIVYGETIKGVEQADDGVNVSFTKGEPETFDVVVAADGSTSTTRPLIMGEDILKNSYKFIGQYMAFFSIPRKPDDPKLWQWYSTDKGRSLMLRPHRNPDTMGAYLVVTTPAREHRYPDLEAAMKGGAEEKKATMKEYLKDAGWQADRILKEMDTADDFYMTRAALVRLPRWTNGRAALLGDAAYATFGVATSLAIEGSYILAGELSKVESSKDIPQALERYEQVFRSVVQDMGDMPSFLPQIFCPQSSWGLSIRNNIIWAISKSQVWKLFAAMGPGKETKLPLYDWVEAKL
jgi:2-polyprenyl-6-methoxyphenol hydroxylase-like FAD-dependent oxidoreductase